MNHGFVLVDDELFDAHQSESMHPERPARLQAARQAVAALDPSIPRRVLPARDATHEELARAHTEAYIQRIDQAAGLTGHFDADTYYGESSVAAARRAAGGSIALVDQLMAGDARLGVGLLRPPGHHATQDRAMGFCIFNNAAVAACHARAKGLERVAIVDWDVHHGNGTEAIFYSDPNVLYVSVHQAPFYPGTGAASDRGSGAGRGYTVNIPLSPGADRSVYTAAFERIVAPIVSEYAPELLLISAGFDAHRQDPLAAMRLDDTSYGILFEQLFAALPREAGGRSKPVGVGILLEGGYHLDALAGSLRSTLEAAVACTSGAGPASRADRPELGSPSASHGLSPVHERELRQVAELQRQHWLLG